MTINKNKILRIFTALLWVVAGTACIMLLISAGHKKGGMRCSGVDIDIPGGSNNFFIDKNDVYAIIKNYGGDSILKTPIASTDLRKIEKQLEKDAWIKNAELYFDNNNVLKVIVEEREPLARIFTVTGNSFYTDSNCMILPLSEKFSARLPIFTGFTSDAKILSKADSILLCDIKNISTKILADNFLMAMIDQVEITPARTFEMTPKIGKQLIIFGDATDADDKFNRLKLFYKNVIAGAGWNRYNTINLQYKNQVIAAIKGKTDVIADSLSTLNIMKMIAEEAARQSADSTQSIVQDTEKNSADSSMIQHSIERDEQSVPAPQGAPIILPGNTVSPSNPVTETVQQLVAKRNTVKTDVIKPTAINTKPVIKKAPVKNNITNATHTNTTHTN